MLFPQIITHIWQFFVWVFTPFKDFHFNCLFSIFVFNFTPQFDISHLPTFIYTGTHLNIDHIFVTSSKSQPFPSISVFMVKPLGLWRFHGWDAGLFLRCKNRKRHTVSMESSDTNSFPFLTCLLFISLFILVLQVKRKLQNSPFIWYTKSQRNFFHKKFLVWPHFCSQHPFSW